MNIANWLHATALSNPEAPALFSGSELKADYHQFAKHASSIGAAMKNEYGIQPGDRVAIFMKNRIEYLKIFYAVWWIGGVVVPINNKLHTREAAWIIENSQAGLLFSDEGGVYASSDLPAGCREIGVDTALYQEMETGSTGSNAPVPIEQDELAWLFYTSGTTGRPKGVMLTHGNLVAMSLCYPLDIDEVTSKDSILYAAPISHGAGLYNFIHVRKGAGHVVPASRGFEPAEILDLAQNIGNLSFFAAPTMVKRLVDDAKEAGRDGRGIKSIIYGGGPMYLADLEEALETFGPIFMQLYGQGESPMTITSLQRSEIADRDQTGWKEKAASVGRAMSCVEVRVVDQAMNDLTSGEPGEVIVRGLTVMKGYWRNLEATKQTLVDGWLKTGDIGHLSADGYLTLTDRSKDVIISGGTNIYPREVEEVLMRHPAIAEVAVIGRPSAEWGEDVVAFIVIKKGEICDVQDLDNWCKCEIASFKKPKHYEFCDALPKSSYGKILKTELRNRLMPQTEI